MWKYLKFDEVIKKDYLFFIGYSRNDNKPIYRTLKEKFLQRLPEFKDKKYEIIQSIPE